MGGKIALVTGAARGLGADVVRVFAENGASVVATDVLHEEGELLVRSIPGAASYLPLDVRDEAAWTDATAEIHRRYGRVDVLVNNAGIARRVLLESCSLEDYLDVVNVNQVGVFLGMRAVIPLMKSSGGSIVNISSIAAESATVPGQTSYAASKWAVNAMTRTAAMELGPYGIRVNSVQPGHLVTLFEKALLLTQIESHVYLVPSMLIKNEYQ